MADELNSGAPPASKTATDAQTTERVETPRALSETEAIPLLEELLGRLDDEGGAEAEDAEAAAAAAAGSPGAQPRGADGRFVPKEGEGEAEAEGEGAQAAEADGDASAQAAEPAAPAPDIKAIVAAEIRAALAEAKVGQPDPKAAPAPDPKAVPAEHFQSAMAELRVQQQQLWSLAKSEFPDVYKDDATALSVKLGLMKLQQTDQAQYLRAKTLDDAMMAAHDQSAQLSRAYEAQQADTRKAQDAQRQAQIAEAKTALIKAVPAWSDTAKAASEMMEIRDYAKSLGFPKEFADNVTDPVAILTIRKAMLFDKNTREQAQAKATVAKRTAGLPKVTPPGTPRDTSPEERVKPLIDRAKRSGKIEDIAAAIEHLL